MEKSTLKPVQDLSFLDFTEGLILTPGHFYRRHQFRGLREDAPPDQHWHTVSGVLSLSGSTHRYHFEGPLEETKPYSEKPSKAVISEKTLRILLSIQLSLSLAP